LEGCGEERVGGKGQGMEEAVNTKDKVEGKIRGSVKREGMWRWE